MSLPSTRPWRVAEFVVHYVYLSTMLLNGVLFLWLPRASQMPYAEYRVVFLVLVGLTAATFPTAFWLYRRYLSHQALEKLHRLAGDGKTSAAFKIGAILLTVVGDTSGIAGASFFTYTRDSSGLAFFLGSWAIQYALSAVWVARGKRYFEALAISATPLTGRETWRVTGS
jgi:hypothetical protein